MTIADLRAQLAEAEQALLRAEDRCLSLSIPTAMDAGAPARIEMRFAAEQAADKASRHHAKCREALARAVRRAMYDKALALGAPTWEIRAALTDNRVVIRGDHEAPVVAVPVGLWKAPHRWWEVVWAVAAEPRAWPQDGSEEADGDWISLVATQTITCGKDYRRVAALRVHPDRRWPRLSPLSWIAYGLDSDEQAQGWVRAQRLRPCAGADYEVDGFSPELVEVDP